MDDNKDITNKYLGSQKDDASLSEKVVLGTKWAFGIRFTRRIFSVGKNIFLARLLAPEDFGLMGIALIGLHALSTFTATGFRAALVQRKEQVDEYLNCAWTLQVIRSLIVVVIIYFLAPFIAQLFKEPRALLVIRAIACIELFRGFTNIRVVFFQKKFEFHKLFIYEMGGVIVDLMIVIPLAFAFQNVWVLVFGILGNEITLCLSSYFIYKEKPKFDFDWNKIKELFFYGKWIALQNITMFLKNSLNSIFIGRLLGVSLLGIYQMSYTIANLSSTEISETIRMVVFPAYSEIQDDFQRIKDVYLRMIKVITFLSVVITTLIVVLADSFINTFLGDKWIAAIVPLKILAIATGVMTIGAASTPLFMGIGRPRISSLIDTVNVILLIVLVYPLVDAYGLNGAALAFCCAAFISFVLFIVFTCKTFHIFFKEIIAVFCYPFIMFLLITWSSSFFIQLINIHNEFAKFFLLTGYCLLNFGFLTFFVERYSSYKLWPLLKTFLPASLQFGNK